MSKQQTLARIVDDYVRLNGEIADLQEKQKALADEAYINGLVRAGSEANARKVVKQLAKEMEMEVDQRANQAQLEMALDDCRVMLGIAVDIQTDIESLVSDIDAGKVDMKFGDEPWISEQREAARKAKAKDIH